ncbi:GGDEF domain-containing protein [Cedecea neteri]|uniref:GGDEF domain-containing protein n=1 Tax=Cedecea neteri TaxID=158822 RepID=UPI0028A06DAC|nr:GGDEF domain-containing protein [Cedecea neteri]
MNFKIHDKLIEEAESAQGLLYRMITAYVCGVTATILILTLTMGSVSRLNFYFFINACTISLLTWFIRKSFHIKSEEKYIASFRIALFLLLNSSFASLTGGLEVLDRDTASLIAAVLYAPAMFIIALSFNRFIKYINNNYKAVINLSLTDELTGLPNRRHLNIKLRELDTKNGTVCIIDIDHFKKINDSHGHDFGDKTLKNIGLQLSHFLSKDIFISRSGGEEFAVIIFNNMSAEAVINEIKDSVSCKDGNGEAITLSIGAAVKQMNSSSSHALAAADKALYRAKRSGRDRIVYA